MNLYAVNQDITGDIVVDDISILNMYLSGDSCSSFTGALNEDDSDGQIYVEVSEGSAWNLTGDSYITSLTCNQDSINLNGHTLYVNGNAYTEGNASTGEAIEISTGSGNSGGNNGGGTPPDKPGGNTSGDMPGGNTSGDNIPGGNDNDNSGINDTSRIISNLWEYHSQHTEQQETRVKFRRSTG